MVTMTTAHYSNYVGYVVLCINKYSLLYSQMPPSGWFSIVPQSPVGAPSPYTCEGSLPTLNSSAPPSQTHLAQVPQMQPSLHLHQSLPVQQSLLQQQLPQAQMPPPTQTHSLQQTQSLAPLSQSTPQSQPLLPSQIPTSQVSMVAPLLPGSGSPAHIDSSANTGGAFCSSSPSPFASAAALPSSAKIHPNPPTSTLPLGQK